MDLVGIAVHALHRTHGRSPRAVKARMDLPMDWYTITDDFDPDFGVDEWHGTNAFIRNGDGDIVFHTNGSLELDCHQMTRGRRERGSLNRRRP